MKNVSPWAALFLGGVVVMAPALQARTCSGNGDVIGGYGWMGSRDVAFVPVLPPATTSTPVVGSNTQIGALTAGSVNTAAFASVGRLYMDGNGGMFSSSAPGMPVTQVGTYVVNSDCTVSATFMDAFATPGGAGLTPVQASATFEGVLVQNANEIDLVQTGASGASAGAIVTLRKARQFNGCTADGLTGTFGLAASGVATTSIVSATGGAATTVSTAFSLFGRVNADGQGNLVQDSLGLTSPLTKRQFTGSYTVNLDCTGSATLVGTDLKSRKVDFVIVSPGGPNANNATQALTFAFTDPGVVGSGLAQQQ